MSTWIEALAARFANLVRRIELKGLVESLREAIEDPDALAKPEPGMEELAQILVEHNLVIPIGPCLAGPPPEPSIELGIGRKYAWQLPVLRDALEKAIRTSP